MFWTLLGVGTFTAEVIWEHFLREKAKDKLPVHLIDLIDVALLTSSTAFSGVGAIQNFKTLSSAVKLAKGGKKVWQALRYTGLGLGDISIAVIQGKKLEKKGKEIVSRIEERDEIERERQELLKKLQSLKEETFFKKKEIDRQIRHNEEIQRHLKEYLQKKRVLFVPFQGKKEKISPSPKKELKYNLETEKAKRKREIEIDEEE
jgi:hypothetical protein